MDTVGWLRLRCDHTVPRSKPCLAGELGGCELSGSVEAHSSLQGTPCDSPLRDDDPPGRFIVPCQRRAPLGNPVDAGVAGLAHDERARLRHQIWHDIQHELSTIMLLASLVGSASDLGSDSRERARHILGETRWLRQLLRAYEQSAVGVATTVRSSVEPVRLDLLAGDVVAATQLSTPARIGSTMDEAWAHVDRLGFRRALRNLVGNAVRAAGEAGCVEVRVTTDRGWAVAEVDDNGPGFGAVPAGMASLGLGIVRDFAAAWGGALEIRRGTLGGCCVRLRLPASAPPDESVTTRVT